MRGPRLHALLALVVCAAAELAVAEERGGDDPGAPRVELIAPSGRVYAGQVVSLGVRVRIGRTYAEERLVQSFQTRLDLPVRVVAPWLDGTDEIVPVPPAPPDEGATLALNDAVVRAPVRRDDAQGETVVEVARRFRLAEPGELALTAPELRFTVAARFDDDVLRGRVPRDPHDARAVARELRLDVRPLPDSGRDAAFGGAVGTFTARARVSPARVTSGAPARIVLEIEGDGDLQGFDPPRPADSAALHVEGVLDEIRDGRRVVTYVVLAGSGGTHTLPPLEFTAFDPAQERYVVVRTEPLVLAIEGPELAPLFPPAAPRPPDRTGAALLIGLVLGLVGLVVLLLLRGRSDRRYVAGVDASRAAAVSAGAYAAEGDAIAGALAEYLAVRLRCPPAAVVGPDLAERLVRAGVDAGLARETAELLEELVAARYGGTAPADARERTDRVLDALSQ